MRRAAPCPSRWATWSIRSDIAKRLGAEIVRLWVASVDFREDVTAREDLMQRVAESYRKVRNTFRYILGNLHGFDPARDRRALRARWSRSTSTCCAQTWEMSPPGHASGTRNSRSTSIYQRLNQFCVVDLSAIYFDVLKDRLYIGRAALARRGARRKPPSG